MTENVSNEQAYQKALADREAFWAAYVPPGFTRDELEQARHVHDADACQAAEGQESVVVA